MQAVPQQRSDDQACRYIAEVIYEHCGIRLDNGKKALIKARLGKRMRHYGFAELGDYCDYVRSQGKGEEFTLMVDALTTNFTNFLRENDHFNFMVQQALPGHRKFHVWSAASSSGEEPYTIAFYLSEVPGSDWHITASDISTKVLEKARLGIYPVDRLAAVPRDWLRKYFQKGVNQWEGQYRVKRTIVEKVTFREINLIGSYDHAQPYQCVFCRNVMIYFDRATQERLITHLCQFLVPKGFLFIGHSESLNGLNVPLRCVRPSIYQRSPM
jgi:chemotaxis protein methyltransferase CheR